MFDPKKIKAFFPIFKRKIKDKDLVYLDSASTSQKPAIVIDAIKNFYETSNANIHRGVYTLSEEATEQYENCRIKVGKFLNAKTEKEIIFTRNTTESINLAAKTWGETNISEDDEIIISAIEHHSNLVPWQELCHSKKAKLKVIPIKDDYTLDLEQYKKMLSPKTKLVAISAMSNVLGTTPPIKEMIAEAKKTPAKILIDAAQSIAHTKTDVRNLDCDFLAFSAHKILGPTGVGILYAKEKILDQIPPFLYGGDMVKVVEQYNATYNDTPWKFEAGTPNIADVVAFEKALQFITETGFENIQKHDQSLFNYAVEKFSKYPEVKLYLPDKSQASTSIISFSMESVHPHDIASVFSSEGVCIRSGHHCNQPLMDTLKVPATARMSFYIYNTFEDIDQAEIALQKVLKIFR